MRKLGALLLGITLAALVGFSTEDEPSVYVGVEVCRTCHPDNVAQWSASPHAGAFTNLDDSTSEDIMRLSGTAIEPFSNPVCLGCHTTAADTEDWERDPTFSYEHGVQCERCHGPGSKHRDRASGAGPGQDLRSSLRIPRTEDCLVCHKPKGSHESVLGVSSFQLQRDWPRAGHALPWKQARASYSSANAATGPPVASDVVYKTPFNLVVSQDGRRLFVACEASGSMIVIDTVEARVEAEVAVGHLPHGVCLAPDQSSVYVSNRGSDTVTVLDATTFEIERTIAVGDEPHGLVVSTDGSTLYVANAGSADISVVDLATGIELKRLAAARGAWGVSLSTDGQTVYVTNNLSHFVPFRATSRSEVTLVATDRSTVRHRAMLPDANLAQGVDVAPDGRFALVTLIRTKNLVPMTRVVQGWVMTNGLGIIRPDGRVDQLLLDEPDSSFADPTDVVITPDGRHAYVTGGGVDAVAVIDLRKMERVLDRASSGHEREELANNFGISTEFVLGRIPVGRNPRGIAVSPDGARVYVADALDDTISIIDTREQRRIGVVPLGGPQELTLTRRGERIFHSATVSYGTQFSCHSCHPDGGVDGITYDIEPDGIGLNPVDNRSLRGILDTAPFKWTGKNKTLSRQCGPRLAVFFTRIQPFTPDQVQALERYICTIPRNPNRYRPGASLTPPQRRGKTLFDRTTANSGKLIPAGQRCVECHPPPYFTVRDLTDVGTGSELDTNNTFDVPHLNNIYETAPYLHDGRAETLEEIWTRFNPDDRHGFTNDMTKDQLNDLIEYLKTL
ncbi:MAG: beta-propeller fold lactonase family protein [bacterium]|nr:beta-propeller fold lactonase family protein [bacterium]